MLALLRLLLIGFVVLTVIYVSLLFYARAQRRDKLAAQWDAAPEGDREAFIEKGLAAYNQSLQRKLLLGIYIVPVCVVLTIIYLTNFH